MSGGRPADDAALPTWTTRRASRLTRGEHAAVSIPVVEEVPVAMVFNGTSHAVMIASPDDLEDLAIGFALSEGIVRTRQEILDLEPRTVGEGIAIDMKVTQRRFAQLSERRRTLAGRTGCGLCGIDSLAQVVRPVAPVAAGLTVASSAIWRALGDLDRHQPLSARTGATHGAAFVGVDGAILLVREDVGRHNALDKLLGALACAGTDAAAGFVLLTSRCSFEMVQKAATCGVAILVAISAPTGLALRLAEQCNMTVVALARADSMMVHTHPQRVVSDR